jgi:hypothetical protein
MTNNTILYTTSKVPHHYLNSNSVTYYKNCFKNAISTSQFVLFGGGGGGGGATATLSFMIQSAVRSNIPWNP